MSELAPLRVLMVEDYPQYFEGLKSELQPRVALDNAPDVATAEALLARTKYDALLLDLSLPPTHSLQEGLGLAEKLAGQTERALPIIILTSKDTDAGLLHKLFNWRVSMIHKDDRPSGAEVEAAVRLALRGYFLLSRLPASDLPELAAGLAQAAQPLFSDRDFAIFGLLAEEGLTNQQIAYRLGLKEDAVKKGVQRIFRAINAASRAEAVRWWFEHPAELKR
ncbi:MAG: response regulator transcription factor [Anaerolineales bacterium]|nr:response regulator transcription factor [Anaerolineales bacterium]